MWRKIVGERGELEKRRKAPEREREREREKSRELETRETGTRSPKEATIPVEDALRLFLLLLLFNKYFSIICAKITYQDLRYSFQKQTILFMNYLIFFHPIRSPYIL